MTFAYYVQLPPVEFYETSQWMVLRTSCCGINQNSVGQSIGKGWFVCYIQHLLTRYMNTYFSGSSLEIWFWMKAPPAIELNYFLWALNTVIVMTCFNIYFCDGKNPQVKCVKSLLLQSSLQSTMTRMTILLGGIPFEVACSVRPIAMAKIWPLSLLRGRVAMHYVCPMEWHFP